MPTTEAPPLRRALTRLNLSSRQYREARAQRDAHIAEAHREGASYAAIARAAEIDPETASKIVRAAG